MNTVGMVQKLYNRNLELEGILLTMHDVRTNLSVQVLEEVKKHFKNKVFSTIIPRNVRLSEAPSHGLPVILYDSSSKGAECYTDLAEEFIENNLDFIKTKAGRKRGV
jgi:chromosome partitioning protein